MVSPRTRHLFLSLLCLSMIGGRRWSGAEEPKLAQPDPLFAGTSLPLPPQQGWPWRRRQTVREVDQRASGACADGLADPRGCEYREVQLACGSMPWARYLTKRTPGSCHKAPRRRPARSGLP